jgi:hypothetical protein
MPFPRERWIEIAKVRGLEQVQARLIEKIGKCPHEQGEVFLYVHPNCRPEGLSGQRRFRWNPLCKDAQLKSLPRKATTLRSIVSTALRRKEPSGRLKG